ncbi:MAG: RNA polymerase sigma-70 factor [Flavobacteriales bacterium]|nr:RNA polymerase sigma-70 factor [Flavobacteriales bacterium]
MSEIADNIVDRIQKGEKNALEELFRACYEDLCGYANGFLKDADETEDVVQEMFFQLWEKREELNITSSVKSYLYRSIHNSCLNKIKHLKVVGEHENYERSTSFDSVDFDENMEYVELEQRVNNAINDLPPERKKVFELSRREGLKYKEIAEHLNISVKTVENQMGKALKYLRESLVDLVGIVVLIIFIKYLG